MEPSNFMLGLDSKDLSVLAKQTRPEMFHGLVRIGLVANGKESQNRI